MDYVISTYFCIASLEEESFNRNNTTMWETSRNSKGRSRQKDTISSQRVSNKTMMERKYVK